MQAVAEQIEVQYAAASCCAFGLKNFVFELASSCGSIFSKVLMGIFGFFGGFKVFVTVLVVYECVL